uniref:Helitron_like_N domain-containing protein n=1 Tax=Syphacia muris TaxID=451379 RepID=A0A0N5ASW8_9BILA
MVSSNHHYLANVPRTMNIRVRCRMLCLTALDKVKDESANNIRDYRRYLQSRDLARQLMDYFRIKESGPSYDTLLF